MYLTDPVPFLLSYRDGNLDSLQRTIADVVASLYKMMDDSKTVKKAEPRMRVLTYSDGVYDFEATSSYVGSFVKIEPTEDETMEALLDDIKLAAISKSKFGVWVRDLGARLSADTIRWHDAADKLQSYAEIARREDVSLYRTYTLGLAWHPMYNLHTVIQSNPGGPLSCNFVSPRFSIDETPALLLARLWL